MIRLECVSGFVYKDKCEPGSWKLQSGDEGKGIIIEIFNTKEGGLDKKRSRVLSGAG